MLTKHCQLARRLRLLGEQGTRCVPERDTCPTLKRNRASGYEQARETDDFGTPPPGQPFRAARQTVPCRLGAAGGFSRPIDRLRPRQYTGLAFTRIARQPVLSRHRNKRSQTLTHGLPQIGFGLTYSVPPNCTSRAAARMETVNPAITSISAMTIRMKNTDVAA